MATRSVERQLSTLLQLGPVGDVPDGQLLQRFAAESGVPDGHAFAALVDRHGGAVLRFCRSVLRDEHAAHDAFQATFLVLVRKAPTLWVRDSLGPWLHAVAYRVASHARAASARRRRAERGGAGREGAVGVIDLDVVPVIHEEVARLPDRYREAIVLCDLEGRSHEEAARRLGCPVGTLKSRQSRGRERLRLRLIGRGLAPSAAAGFGAILAATARAALPGALADSTTKAALAFAAGVGPSRAAALTKRVLTMMFLSRLRVLAPAFLVLGLATVGAFAMVGRSPAATQTPERARAQAPAPKAKEGRIYFSADAGAIDDRGRKVRSIVAVDPKTGDWTKEMDDCGTRPRVAPGGKFFAFQRDGAVWAWKFATDPAPTRLLELEGAAFGTPAWSPDGKQLIISRGRRDPVRDIWVYNTFRVNADGTGLEELKIPPEDGVEDWSSDGKWILTGSSREAKIGWTLYVMHPDGTESRRITEDGNPWPARFSPDGRRIVYSDMARIENRGVWVVDSDGKNRRCVAPFDRGAGPTACWSPDGKRIAILLCPIVQGGAPRPANNVIIVDLARGDRKEFPSPDQSASADMPDWR